MSEVAERHRAPRLLIIEDDEVQLRTLTAIMQDEGFEVIGCSTASAALEHVECDGIGVAVLDLRLPDLHGTISKLKIFRDITERKEAEEQARQHQAELAHISRLSTLGEMAAGIAHGLNQPLFAVLTYAEACRLAISSGRKTPDQVLSDLERISAAATEAGGIVRRLRNFVRKREPSRSTVDVNSLIQSSAPFIEDDIALNGIRLRLELEPRLPTVLVDSLLLQQAILNLARNAIEAMKCRDNGERELLIRTSTAGSETIEVVVRDTGPGLSAESVDKLFEPFFTTKAHGLGLGLSLSRSLVEAEGGRLVAEPNPDRGMTFRFTLPICAGDPDDGA